VTIKSGDWRRPKNADANEFVLPRYRLLLARLDQIVTVLQCITSSIHADSGFMCLKVRSNSFVLSSLSLLDAKRPYFRSVTLK